MDNKNDRDNPYSHYAKMNELTEKNKIKSTKKVNAEKEEMVRDMRKGVAGRSTNSRNNNANRRNGSNEKNKNFMFSFVGVMLIVGAVVSVLVMIFMMGFIGKNIEPKDEKPVENTEVVVNNVEEIEEDGLSEIAKEIAIIKNIDYEQKLITFSNLETEQLTTVIIDTKTTMTDRYGRVSFISQFNVGDCIDVGYNTKTNMAVSIEIDKDSFEYKEVSGVVMNSTSKTISYKNNVYNVASDALMYVNGVESLIPTTVAEDVVTIKGHGNTVYYVNLVSGHGIISVTNKDNIVNGRIEIDRTIVKPLNEFVDTVVTSGNHRVVITGDDVEPFVNEIEVAPNEKVEIDLSVLAKKEGKLIIRSNVTEFVLFINDVEYEYKNGVSLPYGTYKISLQKDMYNSFTGDIVIDSPSKTIQVNLEKIVEATKLGITSVPSGAEIYIDNQLIGITPVEKTVTLGTHTITVKMNGYKSISVPVEAVDSVQKYNIELQVDESAGSGGDLIID